MTKEQIKSLIRHGLTALGVLFTVLGLSKFAGFIEILQGDYDLLWEAGFTIVGAIITYIGYWRDKERFEERAPEAKE